MINNDPTQNAPHLENRIGVGPAAHVPPVRHGDLAAGIAPRPGSYERGRELEHIDARAGGYREPLTLHEQIAARQLARRLADGDVAAVRDLGHRIGHGLAEWAGASVSAWRVIEAAAAQLASGRQEEASETPAQADAPAAADGQPAAPAA